MLRLIQLGKELDVFLLFKYIQLKHEKYNLFLKHNPFS